MKETLPEQVGLLNLFYLFCFLKTWVILISEAKSKCFSLLYWLKLKPFSFNIYVYEQKELKIGRKLKLVKSKVGDFLKILWPSQNILTLM